VASRLPAVALLLLHVANASAQPAPDPGHLPTTVVPTAQSLTLEVDAGQADYRGATRIALRSEGDAAGFRFHAEGLRILSLALSDDRGPRPAAWTADSAGGTVTVTPARPLEAGDYALDIAFSQRFNTRAASFYKLTTGGHAYTFTQFQADDARGAFPCWDEPTYKIPWKVTLVVPRGHLAFANNPIESESERDGKRTVVFKETPPLPSYLVAFATGPFDTVAIPGMSVPGRVITVKGQARLTAEAVAMAPRLLAACERWFGTRHPFDKLDLIAVPEYWYGAMENPGLITFREDLLLVDPAAAPVTQRSRLAALMAHELAHLWFGDLVTLEWWDDMWLNESFASWLGDKVCDEVYPEFEIGLGSMRDRAGAMKTDARLSTRAMRRPVTSAENLLQLADELAYDKGQALLVMVERYVGEERFRRGVQDYVAAWAWDNATAADLWRAISDAGKTRLDRSMASFLELPGVPLVTVTPLEGDKVRLTQRRFLNAGATDPVPTLWHIPVGLLHGDGAVRRSQSVMLTREEAIVRLEGGRQMEWIHPNADEAGYYRWNVPPDMMRRLAEKARSRLKVRERAGFVDNLGALLDAGELRGDDFLRALRPFATDPEPRVVERVASALRRVRTTFVTPEIAADHAAWVRATMTPALDRIGWAPRAGEPPGVSRLRPDLLALLADDGADPRARAVGDSLARAHEADPAQVDPSLLDAALRIAALAGDRARFDDYRRRFESATVPAERTRYLTALAGFRDPALADEALRYTMSGPLRPQELFVVPFTQALDPGREDAVFHFMMDHYDAFAARVPPMFLGFMPRIAAGCDEENLRIAEGFFADPRHQGPAWEQELARTAEEVRDCAGLRAREQAAVAAYLREPGAR
jgi:alanyl aminopeptidase